MLTDKIREEIKEEEGEQQSSDEEDKQQNDKDTIQFNNPYLDEDGQQEAQIEEENPSMVSDRITVEQVKAKVEEKKQQRRD